MATGEEREEGAWGRAAGGRQGPAGAGGPEAEVEDTA